MANRRAESRAAAMAVAKNVPRTAPTTLLDVKQSLCCCASLHCGAKVNQVTAKVNLPSAIFSHSATTAQTQPI